MRAWNAAYVISPWKGSAGADDLKACVLARNCLGGSVTIVVKGALASVMAREMLEKEPEIDIALREEYELAAKEIGSGRDLCRTPGITYRDRESGEIVETPTRSPLQNLDLLPYPARHLIRNSLYLRPDTGKPQTTVQANRGCPSSCVFCLAPAVYGHKLRSRSPANIVGELRECVERHDIRDFFFRADTFTFDRKWVIELCEAIIDSRLTVQWVCNSRVDTLDDEQLDWMKRAGCHGVAFGIESGDQRSLDLMRKGTTLEKCRAAVRLTRKHGVKSLLYFVIGLPWDTGETVERSIRFAEELSGDVVEFHSAIPFPGTELHEIARREGLFDSESLSGFDYSRSPLRSRTLSSAQIEKLRRKAFVRLYLYPAGLARLVRTLWRHAHTPSQCLRLLGFGVRKLASLIHAREEVR